MCIRDSHNGMSEPAIRQALVERYPRESFCLASKLPTFAIREEGQVEAIFNDSRAKSGVDYFDSVSYTHLYTRGDDSRPGGDGCYAFAGSWGDDSLRR